MTGGAVRMEGTPASDPEMMASPLEMIAPPLAMILVIVTALLILSCVTQPLWWKSKLCPRHNDAATTAPALACDWSTHPAKNGQTDSISAQSMEHGEQFLTSEDHVTLHRFARFQNRPRSVLWVSMSALCSLVFCPFTLFLHKPMTEFFWPPEMITSPPSINDVIAAFLMPAGLVYAIVFGFAFQEASGKQAMTDGRMTRLVASIRQVAHLVSACALTQDDKERVFRLLRQDVLRQIKHFIGSEENNSEIRLNVSLTRRLVEVFKDNICTTDLSLDQLVRTALLREAAQYDLNMTQPLHSLVSSMKFIQWLFLEVLGFFAFFGVLMLDGQSYRLELTICMLTVFTISLFCYMLADLDQPFHGVFRVDLRQLAEVVHELQAEFRALQDVLQDTTETQHSTAQH